MPNKSVPILTAQLSAAKVQPQCQQIGPPTHNQLVLSYAWGHDKSTALYKTNNKNKHGRFLLLCR